MKIDLFKIFALSSSFIAITSSAYATCDLDGINMADGDHAPAYVILSKKPAYFRNESEFKKYTAHSTVNSYEACKNHMSWNVIRANNSNQIYMALLSTSDDCDGGNVDGTLFYHERRVGLIYDSSVDCGPIQPPKYLVGKTHT